MDAVTEIATAAERRMIMAKKQKQQTKTCSDCIHENACRIWTDGRFISDASASACPNHETVKESAAYLCGVLDERNRKKTNSDKIRKMTDDELATFLNKIVVNHHIKNADNCNHCPLKGVKPCDTDGISDWLQQPAE